MAKSKDAIYPFVLCGGSGTRLWPISRKSYPKQFHKVVSGNSLFIDTLQRLKNCSSLLSPSIIANEEYQFIIKNQINENKGLNIDNIYLEPVGKNTLPAAVISALDVLSKEPEGYVLLLPCDHIIKNHLAFENTVNKGINPASSGSIVTFGLQPQHPETGFGYIKVEGEKNRHGSVFEVLQFVEKPNLELARRYCESGNYFWNSGIFLFKAKSFLDIVEKLEPTLLNLCKEIFDRKTKNDLSCTLKPEIFNKLPCVSIDYGIMEKTKNNFVVKAEFDWYDVGTWKLLWDYKRKLNKSTDCNVVNGRTITVDTKNSYLYAGEDMLLTTVGLDNMSVIATKDAVLVASLDMDQKIFDLVKNLTKENYREALEHREVFRPWGKYVTLSRGENFLVKEITVNPGEKLSLQMHRHRSEHWVVVKGTAKVTKGKEVFALEENQSTYIERKEMHRLENVSKIDELIVIETQTGNIICEEDIIRFDDKYNRKDKTVPQG